MPYFFCIRGDNSMANITEPDCFAVTDTKDRDWLCLRKHQGETPNDVLDLMHLQQLAHRQGFSSGTSAAGVTCEEPELPQKLGAT